jgi:hypothetical protein
VAAILKSWFPLPGRGAAREGLPLFRMTGIDAAKNSQHILTHSAPIRAADSHEPSGRKRMSMTCPAEAPSVGRIFPHDAKDAQ